jgi:hypothetical protein
MRGCGLGRGRSTHRRRNDIAPRRGAGLHFCFESMLGPRRGKEYRRRQDGRVVGRHHTPKEKTPPLTSGRVGPAMGLCEAGPPSTLPPAIASAASSRGRLAKALPPSEQERSGAQLRTIDEHADGECLYDQDVYDQDVMAPDAELDERLRRDLYAYGW